MKRVMSILLAMTLIVSISGIVLGNSSDVYAKEDENNWEMFLGEYTNASGNGYISFTKGTDGIVNVYFFTSNSYYATFPLRGGIETGKNQYSEIVIISSGSMDRGQWYGATFQARKNSNETWNFTLYDSGNRVLIDCSFNMSLKETTSSETAEESEAQQLTYKDGILTISGRGEVSGRILPPYRIQDIDNYLQLHVIHPLSDINGVVIEYGITSIGDYAFYAANNLKTISLSNSITSIGAVAFYDCDSLESIIIPNSVISIGRSAFASCDKLKSVSIPVSVTSIGDGAFDYCDLTINYEGTEEQWNSIAQNNKYGEGALEKVKINYNKSSQPNPSEQKPTYTNWPFSNSRAVFDRADVGLEGHTEDCSGYYITANDYKKLMIGLGSNVERRKVTGLPRYNSIERDKIRAEYEEKKIWYVEDQDKYVSNRYNVEGNSKYYDLWNGSCYGMVVLGQLLTSKAIDVSNIDYLTNDIGKLEVPSHAVISAINFYQHTQKTSSIQSAASAYAKKSQAQKISDLINYGNIANQTKKPLFIMIDWYSYDQKEGKWKPHGHAITGYGYETGDYEMDGNHYTKRILISDVSAADDERAHLYINDNNEIYIPSHGFRSTTTEMEKSSANNGRITFVSNDTNVWNVVDYITGESHINNSTSVNTIALPQNGDAEISVDAKEWLYKDGYVLDDASGQLVLLFDKLAAEDNSESVTVVMPKGSNYGIKSNTKICADISTSDFYYSVQSNKPGKIDVTTSGTGSVSLNNKGSYLVDITANDGCLNIPWDDISIFGEGSDISFENSERGLIINSDDFSNTEFFVSNDEEEIVFEIDTEKKSILLSEKDGEIAVYEAEKSQEGSKNIIENKKETPINNTSSNEEKNEVSKLFTDVKTPSWYSDAVYYCRDKGYMAGKSNNKFDPNGTVTRATITQVLYAMEGKPAVKKAAGFKDLKSGSWYVDSVNWAASIGIVSGYSKDKFGPNDAITRQQMAAIMYQYAKYKKYDTSANGDISKFKDSGSITKYAVTPMKWAVGHGIISGTNKGLEPKGTATRAQIAVILQAFDKNIKK